MADLSQLLSSVYRPRGVKQLNHLLPDNYVLERDRQEEGLQAPPISPDDLIGSGLFKAAGLGAAGLVGMFAGKGAKTADVVRQGIAEKMLKAGEDPAKVWRETGWGIGPDGKWRFEIPDNKLSVNNSKIRFVDEPTKGPALSDVIDHPELMAAYPELGKVRMYETYKNSGEFVPNNYVSGGGVLGLNPNPRNSKTADPIGIGSVAAHELQHAVQGRDGFAKGGSLESAESYIKGKRIELDELKREIQNRGMYSSDELDEMARQIVSISDELKKTGGLPGTVYERLGGEAEARLTQSRMNMDAAQRAAQYPWEPNYFKGATGTSLSDLIFP